MKTREFATVIHQKEIASGINSLLLYTEKIAKEAVPGQFVSVYCKDGSRILPRPISICESEKKIGLLRLVYRTAGKGTEELSRLSSGDQAELVGPLGNGFPLIDKKAFLIGGGIGIPPMVQLLKELKGEVQIIAGYKDEVFLTEELNRRGNLYIATEDGSTGIKGNVLDAIRENGLTADLIYACGPKPMLKAIQAYARENEIECYISLEERMACGIGACLSCVCETKEMDAHTRVNKKRICKDGPVFLSTEVEL